MIPRVSRVTPLTTLGGLFLSLETQNLTKKGRLFNSFLRSKINAKSCFFGACRGQDREKAPARHIGCTRGCPGSPGTPPVPGAFLALAAAGIVKKRPRGRLDVPGGVPGAFLSRMSLGLFYDSVWKFKT